MVQAGAVNLDEDIAGWLTGEEILLDPSWSQSDLLSVVLRPLPADAGAGPALHVDVVRPAVAGLVTVQAPRLLQLRHLQQNKILSLSFTLLLSSGN